MPIPMTRALQEKFTMKYRQRGKDYQPRTRFVSVRTEITSWLYRLSTCLWQGSTCAAGQLVDVHAEGLGAQFQAFDHGQVRK